MVIDFATFHKHYNNSLHCTYTILRQFPHLYTLSKYKTHWMLPTTGRVGTKSVCWCCWWSRFAWPGKMRERSILEKLHPCKTDIRLISFFSFVVNSKRASKARSIRFGSGRVSSPREGWEDCEWNWERVRERWKWCETERMCGETG